MTGCPTRQVHDCAGNVFRPTQPPVRILLRHLCLTAVQGHQSRGHLRGEEAWRDAVAKDVSRAELDGQIAGKVNCSRYRGQRALTTKKKGRLESGGIPLDAE